MGDSKELPKWEPKYSTNLSGRNNSKQAWEQNRDQSGHHFIIQVIREKRQTHQSSMNYNIEKQIMHLSDVKAIKFLNIKQITDNNLKHLSKLKSLIA